MSVRAMTAILLALALPLCAAAQGRQTLLDPTRPPPEALRGTPGAAVEVSGPRKPVLQSVLVGKGYEGREVAVINGVVVRKGEKFDGAVLESVSTNEAVLRRGNQKETLVLFPLAAGSRKK